MLKTFLRGLGDSAGEPGEDREAADAAESSPHDDGEAEPESPHPGAVYEHQNFDGRSAAERDPEGVWVAPNGVEVLTLRWAKRYGPGLQPLFAQVASFVGLATPEWEVAHQKDHRTKKSVEAARARNRVHRRDPSHPIHQGSTQSPSGHVGAGNEGGPG